MKRQNGVYLFGVVKEWKVRRASGERARGSDGLLPAVDLVVVTDAEAYGGHHPVVAYGRQAAEVIAFAETWRKAVEEGQVSGPLYVTVEGWLRSRGGHSVVVADGIHFSMPDTVRAEAKVLLNRLLRGVQERAVVRADGRGGRGRGLGT